MPGAITRKRLFGPALLTNAAATKYTVPASTLAQMNQIHLSNGSSVAATYTVSIGADAAGTRIADAVSLPANSMTDIWFQNGALAAAEVVQALSGTTGVITMTIWGSETTLG